MTQTITLYTLEVYITSGPMTDKFIKKNPVICRTIQIRGDQTLGDLHQAIFDAFDREEEHMYEFQIGGKGPNDPDARCYGSSVVLGEIDTQAHAGGDADKTRMDDLKLTSEDVFGYWFDFGDDWWHQINVMSIEETTPSGDYPKVIGREGKSPPQYIDE